MVDYHRQVGSSRAQRLTSKPGTDQGHRVSSKGERRGPARLKRSAIAGVLIGIASALTSISRGVLPYNATTRQPALRRGSTNDDETGDPADS